VAASNKVVLITGASSGIGQSTARLLAQQGFTIFGTSRNPSGIDRIPGIEFLPLDVRLDESVKSCVETLLKRAGRLDILVNNAGYELGGAIEEAALEEVKAQFETNFFGAVRMVRMVLPIMRRQDSGQIINISSLAGLTPPPFMGFYAATKFALEGYTEVLRHEVKHFNIRVSLVEPPYIRTNLWQTRQYPLDRIGDYDPWRHRVSKSTKEYQGKAPEPGLVAECILRIIETQSPRLRYVVGKRAALAFRLRRFLPESQYEKVVRRLFGLDVKK